jgi:hypothetical protein
MAKKFWPNESPSANGRHTGKEYREVVGVAKTVKYVTLGETPQAAAYYPLQQSQNDTMVLCVRTTDDPARIVPPRSRNPSADALVQNAQRCATSSISRCGP